MKTAYNVWGPEHRDIVDPIFQQRVQDENVPAKNQAALRSAIYKECFNELEDVAQQAWITRAEREHQEALSKVEDRLHAAALTTPEARQR